MLHGLVHELIVPSVKTKDVEVRAEGLICLGLCGLLDKVSRILRSSGVYKTDSGRLLETCSHVVRAPGSTKSADGGNSSDQDPSDCL